MTHQQPTTGFWHSNWKQLLASFAIAGMIVGITVLTTRTDDLSSNQQVAASQSAMEDAQNEAATTSSATSTGVSTDTSSSSTRSISTSTKEEASSSDPYDVSITAESAVVWNVQTRQVLFAKQPDKEQPLASLTKLMTALVGVNQIAGTTSTSTTISRQHLDASGNNGLVAGQSWDTQDLISFMLIESSNDAARAVAAAGSDNKADGYAKEFVDAMNSMARTLGLKSTYFFNPSGLDLNETLVSGGYGSAKDMALLFDYILHTNQHILTPTTEPQHTFHSADGQTYIAENTNTWLSNFSNVLGSKTGYTVLAGGNLIMGFDLKEPVIIVVMGSTKDGRFQDVQTLYNATQKHFSQQSTSNNVVTSP